MTQQDKELLLKDLCARLPYNVKIQITILDKNKNVIEDFDYMWLGILYSENPYHEIKPYLRPMLSMTEEEKNEWADLFNLELDKLNDIDDEEKAEELAPMYFGNSHYVSIDWLNSHHFDYRGLIKKGLALEAKEGMYN